MAYLPSTVVTVLTPVQGSDSCIVSFVGVNVAIHVCRYKCYLTITPPDSRTGGLLNRVITTLQGHLLELLSVSIILHDDVRVYSIQCQAAGPYAELLRNTLYTALQRIADEYADLLS